MLEILKSGKYGTNIFDVSFLIFTPTDPILLPRSKIEEIENQTHIMRNLTLFHVRQRHFERVKRGHFNADFSIAQTKHGVSQHHGPDALRF